MITDVVQRWTLGREYRRPAGELIRPSEYDVEPTAEAATAREFVATHHYARSASSTAHRFGLYRWGGLVGVALFGPPASMAAHRAVFPTLTIREAVTLGRLVLLDSAPGNSESYFVARCFEVLRGRGIVAVETCADPEPRTDAAGRRVFRGHAGCIYQALSARFLGRTRRSTLRLLPDGTVLSNRSVGKLVRGERGAKRAVADLVRWGAEPLQDGEDALAWVRRWRAELTRPMRHHGCLRYVFPIDRRRRREVLSAAGPALPYLKLDAELARRAA